MKGNKKTRFKYRAVGVALQDECVLLYQTAGNSYWSLPGGRIERGEQAQTALMREMQEEASIEVQVGRLVWVGENFYTKGEKQIHELALYFLMTVLDSVNGGAGTAFGGNEGKQQLIFGWHALGELDQVTLYPLFLKQALRAVPDGIGHFVEI